METTRVIFFAGNAIPPNEVHEMPDIKGAGGIYLPHIRTLPQGPTNGSKGMVYQCKFTPLKTARKSEWNMMLSPEARNNWDKEFVQTSVENGVVRQKNVKGFVGSNQRAAKQGTFVEEISDHIVHQKRYPGEEIEAATTRSVGQGVGGVVEIVELQGATNAEIDEVQHFFFPNWNKIAQGIDALPNTIDGVEALIRDRINAIPAELAAEHQGKYRNIGRDMLKSCTEFRRTGTLIIEKDEAAVKAAAKDDSQTHSPISEHLLGQLKIKRKGELLAGDHSAINRLAEVMEKKETSGDALEAQRLLLEERKQYVAELTAGIRERDLDEEIRLGIRKATDPMPVQPTPVVANTYSDPAPGVSLADSATTTATMEYSGYVERTYESDEPTKYAIGDVIHLPDGSDAEVIGNPFGRAKVRLADGTETMLDKL